MVIAFLATSIAVSSGMSINALEAANAYEPPEPIAAAQQLQSRTHQALKCGYCRSNVSNAVDIPMMPS